MTAGRGRHAYMYDSWSIKEAPSHSQRAAPAGKVEQSILTLQLVCLPVWLMFWCVCTFHDKF